MNASDHDGPARPKKPVSRRTALKGLAIGGGIGALTQWSKPVVDAVVLPAHAQATVQAQGRGALTIINVVFGL